MLYPAQLYKQELSNAMTAKWYDPEFSGYFAGEYRVLEVPDNTDWRRDFVHLDANGKVDGYFAYSFNNSDRSAHNFGLCSFTKFSRTFLKDCIKNIQDLFLYENCQRVQFEVFTDNIKAVRLYEKFRKKYNGTRLCTVHRNVYFNGKFHDTYIYEFLVENIRNFLTEDLNNEVKSEKEEI